MANYIVYLQWGERYTQQHIDRLFDQVNKNCSVPFEFMTMRQCHVGDDFNHLQYIQNQTYRGDGDPESSITEETQSILREDAGGMCHFRKFLMFRYDWDYFEDDDTILYLDLDSIILKDLAYFFELNNDKPWIARSYDMDENGMWQRLYRYRSCPYYNSSVLVWKPGQNRKIINEFKRSDIVSKNFYQYGMIDNWLHHRFGPWTYNDTNRNWFNTYPPDIVNTNDNKVLTDDTIIRSLAGMTQKEKDEILCLS